MMTRGPVCQYPSAVPGGSCLEKLPARYADGTGYSNLTETSFETPTSCIVTP